MFMILIDAGFGDVQATNWNMTVGIQLKETLYQHPALC